MFLCHDTPSFGIYSASLLSYVSLSCTAKALSWENGLDMFLKNIYSRNDYVDMSRAQHP